ncbi:MAG: hypothetical protein ACOYXM_04960 [Actinomycetota bacterium]
MSTLAERATAWADGSWDEGRSLLWNPPGSFDELTPPRSLHMVPQSAWYAVGLLMRGDAARAERVLHALCSLQYDRPGVVWHGTFARFAEWPDPPDADAVEWVDYNPNWRQFVGTTFALILRSFPVSADLEARMRHAIDLAIAGEPRDRVPPGYSNIALMKAWLEADESYAQAIVEVFDEHGAFEEYGSPTYYGIDLLALALWRQHPPTPHFAEWGQRLWSVLWADIARWWHPGLRNLCGPYSRAYGMDMSGDVGLLGLWMPEPAMPSLGAPFGHSHDMTMAPLVQLLGGGPIDAKLSDEERVVEQQLPGGRTATGWLAPGVMAGGERGAPFRAEGQFHPATAHWAMPGGSVGWLRLRHRGRVSATATEGVLTVEVHDHHRLGRQPVMVDTSHGGELGARRWTLPGRTIAYDGPPADADGVIDAGESETLTLRFR